MNKKIHGYTVKYYDFLGFLNGICSFWNKEIGIDKKWKNTPINKLILEHELQHLDYIEEYRRTKSHIVKNWISIVNDIFDYFDCLYISIKIFLLKLKMWQP
jgi:hypothetical protein